MRACVILPVYNHPAHIERLVAHLLQYDCEIIIVDDGSDEVCQAVLDAVVQTQREKLTLIRHTTNQGKGQAVMTALRQAYVLGYSHALQIDADGQHEWQDIGKFLCVAKEHPKAMIIGTPIYGDDVPKSRLYGRYATHIWVWINTLSLSITDSMCGFRVYPVAASMAIIDAHQLPSRMGFDTEILVRLSWAGVRFINVPTQVTYPADGVSHFNIWSDNIELTRVHAKLFGGMLMRAPRLMYQKFRRDRLL